MNKLKKNYIYNLLYQVLILFIPLITAPYLSRVVGPEGVGTYSYTYSIVYYFTLCCLLGVNNYGNRKISQCRDNEEEKSRTFWEIYWLQLILGIIMLILYYVYCFCICKNHRLISIIQGIQIIGAILDIGWFYFGIEDFKLTILRNSFVKIFSLVLIFLLVKTSSDLWKYTLIITTTIIISESVFWMTLPKKITMKFFLRVNPKDILKHLKPNLILFVPVIAISLFKCMDKIMLGTMTTVKEVGLYESAEKITSIPLSVVSALGTVLLPHISNLIKKGENEKVIEYLYKSLNVIFFISIPMSLGLSVVGKSFAPLYYGDEFFKSGTIIGILSLSLVFSSIASVVRMGYLIPKEKDIIYIKSVIIGAALNLFLNFILIPKYMSIGAGFATLVTEIAISIYQFSSLKKIISFKKVFLMNVRFLITGLFMYLVLLLLEEVIILESFIKIVVEVLVGGLIYVILNCDYLYKKIRKVDVKNGYK